jgi:hypothetical protein
MSKRQSRSLVTAKSDLAPSAPEFENAKFEVSSSEEEEEEDVISQSDGSEAEEDADEQEIDDAVLDYMGAMGKASLRDGSGKDGAGSAEGREGVSGEEEGDEGRPGPAAAHADEASDSSEDERPNRNTVGSVPLEWYAAEEHIGYDKEGNKIIKKGRKDKLEQLLARNDSSKASRACTCLSPCTQAWAFLGLVPPSSSGTLQAPLTRRSTCTHLSLTPAVALPAASPPPHNPCMQAWRTIYDDYNDEEIVLSKEEVRMIQRIRAGQFPHLEVNPYEPEVSRGWACMCAPMCVCMCTPMCVCMCICTKVLNS